MRRTVAALAAGILTLACGFLAACQPTPEKPAVVHREEPAARQTAEPPPEETPETPDYDAPERCEDTFSAKDERVIVTVDADVVLPVAGSIPIAEAAPAPFSMDFVKKAAEVLLEGRPVYEPRVQLTKGEIEAEILELRQALADPANSTSDGLRSGDPATIAEVTKLFEDRIAIYERLYEDAPQTYEPVPAAFEFHNQRYYTEAVWYEEDKALYGDGGEDGQGAELLESYERGQIIQLTAELAGGYQARLSADNFDDGAWKSYSFGFTKAKELNSVFYPDVSRERLKETSVTEEQAAQTAQELMERLGLADFALSDVQPMSVENPLQYKMGELTPEEMEELNAWTPDESKVSVWSVSFRRTAGGVPVLEQGFRLSNPAAGEESYAPEYENERILITVGDDGVMAFEWYGRLEQTRVINPAAELLPFEEMMDAFRTHASLAYTFERATGLYQPDPQNPDPYLEEMIASIENAELTVTEIELGLRRMPVKDDPGVFRLEPVWLFNGYTEVRHKEGMEPEGYVPFDASRNAGLPPAELAAVSALDGSILGGM